MDANNILLAPGFVDAIKQQMNKASPDMKSLIQTIKDYDYKKHQEMQELINKTLDGMRKNISVSIKTNESSVIEEENNKEKKEEEKKDENDKEKSDAVKNEQENTENIVKESNEVVKEEIADKNVKIETEANMEKVVKQEQPTDDNVVNKNNDTIEKKDETIENNKNKAEEKEKKVEKNESEVEKPSVEELPIEKISVEHIQGDVEQKDEKNKKIEDVKEDIGKIEDVKNIQEEIIADKDAEPIKNKDSGDFFSMVKMAFQNDGNVSDEDLAPPTTPKETEEVLESAENINTAKNENNTAETNIQQNKEEGVFFAPEIETKLDMGLEINDSVYDNRNLNEGNKFKEKEENKEQETESEKSIKTPLNLNLEVEIESKSNDVTQENSTPAEDKATETNEIENKQEDKSISEKNKEIKKDEIIKKEFIGQIEPDDFLNNAHVIEAESVNQQKNTKVKPLVLNDENLKQDDKTQEKLLQQDGGDVFFDNIDNNNTSEDSYTKNVLTNKEFAEIFPENQAPHETIPTDSFLNKVKNTLSNIKESTKKEEKVEEKEENKVGFFDRIKNIFKGKNEEESKDVATVIIPDNFAPEKPKPKKLSRAELLKIQRQKDEVKRKEALKKKQEFLDSEIEYALKDGKVVDDVVTNGFMYFEDTNYEKFLNEKDKRKLAEKEKIVVPSILPRKKDFISYEVNKHPEELIMPRSKQNRHIPNLYMTSSREDLLIKLIDYGMLEELKTLVSYVGDVNHVLTSKYTLLTYSIKNKKYDIVRYLIFMGANIDKRDDRYETPLMMAIKNNDLVAINILVKAGANLDQIDLLKRTPLIYAIEKGYEYIAILLINNGADINIPNGEGEGTLSLSNRLGKNNIYQKIMEKWNENNKK